MPKKTLVTGGAGFIGSHLSKQLLSKGQQVVVLDDLSGGSRTNVHPGVEFIHGSVCDVTLINKLFEKHCFDYVYHLAAYAAEGLSHFIRRYNYQNNLLGSVNLINASVNHNIKCFVFTSSIAVYGNNTLPYRETQIPQPVDPYGIAKHAVEQDLRSAHDQFGLNYIIFRPHNVYGPNQKIGDKYRNVIGIFMNQLMKDEAMTIFGSGEQTRAFSYIDDVVIPIADSINEPKAYCKTINIGGAETHSIVQLAKAVAKAMKSSNKIAYLSKRNEVTHAYADHSRFDSIFGQYGKTSLSEGLSLMAEWASKKGQIKTQLFEDLEIKKGLPETWT